MAALCLPHMSPRRIPSLIWAAAASLALSLPSTAQSALHWDAVISGSAVAGATSRGELSNALLTLTKPAGTWQFSITAGAYSLPALGAPWQSTSAYTGLFGPVPQAWVTWAPSKTLSLRAGQLPSLLGQESPFTYQNINIQRGLLWNDMENTFSRAAELDYANGRWSAALQFGDGFYSRRFGAVSGVLSYSASKSDSVAVALLWPNRATPPNATFHDANARVFDLMWTHQSGPWNWTPYLLWFDSPANASAGFMHSARAAGAAWITSYRWSKSWSLGMRAEYAGEAVTEATGDAAHQDILAFGPGARAWSLTATPAWRRGNLFVRGEMAAVGATTAASRRDFVVALEVGIVH